MIFSLWKHVVLVTLPLAIRGEYISTANYPVYNDRSLKPLPHHRFYSSEESSPVLQINVWNESAISSGASHIFLRESHYAVGTSSPVILDAKDLSTVYVDHASGFEGVYGTRIQENLGKKYLTFWAGRKDDGFGTSDGFGLAYDENYRLVYNVSAHNVDRHSDLHEFAFTGTGTVLVLAVEDVSLDPSEWPEWEGSGFKTMARDNVIQEIDLETNELLFSWRALDHINPVDSFELPGPYWDIFHTNSIQKVRNPENPHAKPRPMPVIEELHTHARTIRLRPATTLSPCAIRIASFSSTVRPATLSGHWAANATTSRNSNRRLRGSILLHQLSP